MLSKTTQFLVWVVLSMAVMIGQAYATALHNVTVDDTDTSGILSYNTPSKLTPGWNAVSPGHPCTQCSLQPDPSQAFNGTWHDDTWELGDGALFVQLDFTGPAVYLFNIIPNDQPDATTNLTFVLDGVVDGHFLYKPDGSSTFRYNVSVYSRSNITDGPHSLQMISRDGTQDETILFDYAIYTSSGQGNTPASPDTSEGGSGDSHTSIVIGLVLALAIIVFGVVGIVIWRRRYFRRTTAVKLADEEAPPDEKLPRALSMPVTLTLPYSAETRQARRIDPFAGPTESSPTDTYATGYPSKLAREFMRDNRADRSSQSYSQVLPSTNPPSTVSRSSSGRVPGPNGEASILREQMDTLWQEMARLRAVQEEQGTVIIGAHASEPLPPVYEEPHVSRDLPPLPSEARGVPSRIP